MTTNLPVPRNIQPGWNMGPGRELVIGSPHEVAARIRSDRTIRELGRYELARGRHLSVVERIKPRPSRARRTVLWAAGAFLGLSALGIAVWALLSVVVPAAATAASGAVPVIAVLLGLWALKNILTGHRAACPGIVTHCKGCRH